MASKERRGRVTPSKRSQLTGPGASRAPAPSARTSPETSARYTRPTPAFRLRPGWHRYAGWGGVILGAVVAAANDVMLMGEDLTLLPGGHSELYLLIGIALAGGATWFLGAFDRGTTIYEKLRPGGSRDER